MDDRIQRRFQELLGAEHSLAAPVLDSRLARRLIERTADVPFLAHSYSFCHHMEHGGFGPRDLLRFVTELALRGASLHINDGGRHALSRMTGRALEDFALPLRDLGVALHLEISSTDRREVDRAAEIAVALGVKNIRLYARHHGRLSQVMQRIHDDLCYACERAAALDLYFDYEQHEDLKAAEIVAVLERIGDRRLNVLFDYANSLNACEEPMEAFRILSPYIRQVHIKGARRTVEGDGWGQLGVRQGSDEDEMPGALLLFNLLMLGEEKPQVVGFALEQEVGYYAPPLRRSSEPPDPPIPYREPSETPLDPARSLQDVLDDERRLAVDQVAYNRMLVQSLREIAIEALAASQTAGA